MGFKKILIPILSFLIILTLVVSPFSAAKAATVGYGATNLSGGGTNLNGLVGSVSGLFTKLPECSSYISGGIKTLFNKAKIKILAKAKKKLETTTQAGVATLKSVSVSDTNTLNEVANLNVKIDELKASNDEIKKATVSDNKSNVCLNAIGKAYIKTLVDRLTVSTVNWIQTGNFGDSFFVKNQSVFFTDLKKEQILAFGQELSDSAKYPFAKNFMMNTVNGFNNTFQQNAQYSLNKYLQNNSGYSAQDFSGDFSKGGWGAWDALVQNPANNPLGFSLMAANELQRRIEEEATATKDELAQSGGFLDMKICADPRGVTKEEDANARRMNSSVVSTNSSSTTATTGLISSSGFGSGNIGTGFGGTTGGTTGFGGYGGSNNTNITTTNSFGAEITQSTETYRKCNRWETTTPGGIIANELTKSMDNSKNALLSGDTLNDAIAAILDAALAKLTSTLTDQSKGLMDISDSDIEVGYDSSNYSDGGISSSDYDQSQTEKDYSDYQRENSSWLKAYPNFDIRNDLNQALIDEQRIYVEMLKEQSKNLFTPAPGTNNTIDGNTANNTGLIPAIYQLDYCIPGPNPNWQENTENAFKMLANKMEAAIADVKDMSDGALYKIIDLITLGVGSTIIDIVNTYSFDCGGTGGADIGNMIGQITAGMLGMNPGQVPSQTNLCSMNGFEFIFDETLEGYSQTVSRRFNLRTLPKVANEARAEFGKVIGYEKIAKDNEGAIAFQEGVIKGLEKIKKTVDDLNLQLANGTISQTTYEEKIILIKNDFARLSANLVTGDDIAQVDNFNKEIIDKTKYIINDLLQGPYGCEKELNSNEAWEAWPWQLADKARPDYQKAHMYNYWNWPIVPVGDRVYKNKNGEIINTKSFLGSATFANGDDIGFLPKEQSSGPWSLPKPNEWVSDYINLHKRQSGAALNFSGTWGGSARGFEQLFNIY